MRQQNPECWIFLKLLNKMKIFLIILLSLFLYSCIGEDFIEIDPSQDRRVIISGPSSGIDTIILGSTKSYSASYFDEYGIKRDRSFDWRSSNTSVANVDANGKISTFYRGITQISANTNGVSTAHNLVVRSIERIELSAPQTFLLTGQFLQLSAGYFDANNQSQAASISWFSADNKIATVNSSGIVSALQKGQTYIYAQANNIVSDSLLLNVVNDSNEVATVRIIQDTNQLFTGESFLFTSEIKNAKGEILSLQISWSSNDSNVISINRQGMARALRLGNADIRARAGGVRSAKTTVIVADVNSGRRSGAFQGDNGYTVSGNVEMRQGSTGSLELAFENLNSQAGPALYINLSNSPNTAGIEIQELTQLNGSYTVTLPANIRLNDYNYVLIWCKSANAGFGSAQLN